MRNSLLLLFTILVFFFSCQCDDEIGTDVDPNPMIETVDRIDINNLEVGQMNRYVSFQANSFRDSMIYQNDLNLEVEVIDYADGEITFEERKISLLPLEEVFESRETHFTLDESKLIHNNCDGEEPSFLVFTQELNFESQDSVLLEFDYGIWQTIGGELFGDHTTDYSALNKNYDYLQVNVDLEPCGIQIPQGQIFYSRTFYSSDEFIVRSLYNINASPGNKSQGWDLLVE